MLHFAFRPRKQVKTPNTGSRSWASSKPRNIVTVKLLPPDRFGLRPAWQHADGRLDCRRRRRLRRLRRRAGNSTCRSDTDAAEAYARNACHAETQPRSSRSPPICKVRPGMSRAANLEFAAARRSRRTRHGVPRVTIRRTNPITFLTTGNSSSSNPSKPDPLQKSRPLSRQTAEPEGSVAGRRLPALLVALFPVPPADVVGGYAIPVARRVSLERWSNAAPVWDACKKWRHVRPECHPQRTRDGRHRVGQRLHKSHVQGRL